MARMTIEDCLDVIPNRFELVIVAAERAKDLVSGSLSGSTSEGKCTVVALREVSERKLDPEQIMENIVKSYQSSQFIYDDTAEEDASIAEVFKAHVDQMAMTMQKHKDQVHVNEEDREEIKNLGEEANDSYGFAEAEGNHED